mmetsp:Transcript_26150/g.59545  ORF Transcript_26150/g.59545 Transcript_26150/m.59545 type:complete len:167 (+) Transcript_26150:84-584(+)
MFQPRSVVLRELDGLPFVVVVLRVQDGVADVAYLDDGNVEVDVPLDELAQGDGNEVEGLNVDPDQRFEEGLAWLLAEEDAGREDSSRPATASTMHWDDGRYVAEDGAVVLSPAASPPKIEASLQTKLERDPELPACKGPAACGPGLRGIRCLRKGRGPMRTAPVAA